MIRIVQVAPANGLVDVCRRKGGKVVMVDVDPAALALADVGLCGKAGEVLPKLVAALQPVRL